MMAHLEECFPGRHKIEYQYNNADYVYLCENLENLSGKKYHEKKSLSTVFVKRMRIGIANSYLMKIQRSASG